jgi:hypothetical protein
MCVAHYEVTTFFFECGLQWTPQGTVKWLKTMQNVWNERNCDNFILSAVMLLVPWYPGTVLQSSSPSRNIGIVLQLVGCV